MPSRPAAAARAARGRPAPARPAIGLTTGGGRIAAGTAAGAGGAAAVSRWCSSAGGLRRAAPWCLSMRSQASRRAAGARSPAVVQANDAPVGILGRRIQRQQLAGVRERIGPVLRLLGHRRQFGERIAHVRAGGAGAPATLPARRRAPAPRRRASSSEPPRSCDTASAKRERGLARHQIDAGLPLQLEQPLAWRVARRPGRCRATAAARGACAASRLDGQPASSAPSRAASAMWRPSPSVQAGAARSLELQGAWSAMVSVRCLPVPRRLKAALARTDAVGGGDAPAGLGPAPPPPSARPAAVGAQAHAAAARRADHRAHHAAGVTRRIGAVAAVGHVGVAGGVEGQPLGAAKRASVPGRRCCSASPARLASVLTLPSSVTRQQRAAVAVRPPTGGCRRRPARTGR